MNNNNNLTTFEYEKMNKDCPLSEYPLPQLKRDSYLSLNGLWKYKISKSITFDNIDNDILIPFPIESIASLVNKRLNKNEYIIYKRNFKIDSSFIKDKVFIHFLGVDQSFKIILNNTSYDEIDSLGLPTKIDVTDSIDLENELIVIAKDNLDPIYPKGKQSLKPKGIFYTPFSGIYYPVFIESVSNNYIKDLSIHTTLDTVNLDILSDSDYFEIKIMYKNEIISSTISNNNKVSLKIENPILWDIQNPFLYDLEIKTKNDKITSYFGLREISMNNDGFIYLNNKKIFINGVLDQGYYPEGIITPSTYKSLEFDILSMKELGFNTLRKHIKIEIPYFYYLCDKYGMLVFQDFVNNGKYNFFWDTALPTIGFQTRNDKNLNKNPKQRESFIKAGIQTINYLSNHPSIIGYTIFNEGWGQFDSDNVYKKFKSLFPNILFDTSSGWHRGAKSDFNSYHWYFKNLNKLQTATEPIFLSEFGALCYKDINHCYSSKCVFGYKYFNSYEELNNAFVGLYQNKIIPYKDKLVGIIYTQLSDIEEEDNGLLTYDRKVLKLDKDIVKNIMNELNK